MRKLILASVSAVALFGVAACSDTDTTTTQSVEPPADTVVVPTDPAAPAAPQAVPSAPAESMEPATPAPVTPAPAPAQ